MKILSIAAAALAALFVMQNPAPAAEKESPTYIENQTILDAFGKTGAPPLVPGEQYNVAANRRTANGQVEIHEKETDILLVVDGSATFVTGGKAIEPTTTRPGQIRAKSIEGGQTYNLKKGDMVVIPAGQPHWFKQVNGFVNYLAIKSVKP